MAVLACLNGSRAQDDVDYRYEIGAALGGSFYRGQLNHKFFGQPGVAGGVVGRWNINPYMAVKAMLERAGFEAPRFTVDPTVTDFYAFSKNSFTMEGYRYHDFDFEIPMAI